MQRHLLNVWPEHRPPMENVSAYGDRKTVELEQNPFIVFVFVAAFYETRGKTGYFNKAREISSFHVDPQNVKQAFLNLVSGVEDFAEAEKTTTHLMGEMSRRIQQNLDLREDKQALQSGARSDQIQENVRFFEGIEGLALLSPENAIDGLYVVTRPRIGLAQVHPHVDAAVMARSAIAHLGDPSII